MEMPKLLSRGSGMVVGLTLRSYGDAPANEQMTQVVDLQCQSTVTTLRATLNKRQAGERMKSLCHLSEP